MTDLLPHEKARAWRKRNRYSQAQLAKLTGFSTSSILDFETGIQRGGPRPVSASAMRRYRLAVAAISAGLQDWSFDD